MLRHKFIFFYVILTNSLFCNSPIESKLTNDNFKLGLENISENLLKLLLSKDKDKGKLPGIALVTNQTGIDSQNNRNIDILLSKGLDIRAIFAPEHGFKGNVKAEKKIVDLKDEKTQIPIRSLYLGDSKFKKFDENELKDIKYFIFDIQDSGMRHYTYISILFKIMQICAEFNKKLIVLDRPNILGSVMEGPLVHQSLISFVSIAPIPVRHALTVGELAKFFNKFCFKTPIKLIVVPMKNYTRDRGLKRKLSIYLSPNLRNINACFNYSFLGILGEINPFSILANTDHAFECFMVPDTKKFKVINWQDLSNLLEKYGVNSKLFKYEKPNGQKLIGLKVYIKDINKFSGFKTILAILNFFKKNGIKFYYSKNFNKVIGTYQFRHFIDKSISKEKFYDHINKELKQFYEKAKNIFLYNPLPKLVELK